MQTAQRDNQNVSEWCIWNKSYVNCRYEITYLSREHMNPQLTCSQRQWLHSSVGRASHRYREVTGSSPVEVLNVFQASLRNCKNCDHNCEDHSSFDNQNAKQLYVTCAKRGKMRACKSRLRKFCWLITERSIQNQSKCNLLSTISLKTL